MGAKLKRMPNAVKRFFTNLPLTRWVARPNVLAP
jgi:hypothetical protein